MKLFICQQCHKQHECTTNQFNNGRKFCSTKCRGISNIGNKISEKIKQSLSIKAKKRWADGVYTEESKFKMGWSRNKKQTKEHRENISKSKKCEGNPMWKGNNVGIESLHGWVRRRKLKPDLCERCNKVVPYDLANISQEYKRDINDFEWLCRKCHMTKDGRLKKLKINQTRYYIYNNVYMTDKEISSYEKISLSTVRWRRKNLGMYNKQVESREVIKL